MDDKYYSRTTLERFIKKTLCDNDPITYKHYKNDNVKLFRKRLKTHNQVEQVVYVMCTNVLRDIIFDVIGKITLHMKEWGDIIVTGGEAFNNYFDVNQRVITSDIDTKFVPRFMSVFEKKFFGYLQYCKLYLWDYIGYISKKFNKKFRERIDVLSKTKIGKLLGIRVSREPISLKRRYTLIKKSVKESVLIDVELFALDLNIRYYSPKDKKISERTLGGILDIPMMRQYEIGYEVASTRERGIFYPDPVTEKIIYNPNILIASKKFLIDDLFLMKQLKLRPEKIQKDRKRMVSFSKYVLKINDIKSTTPDDTIYRKVHSVIGPAKKNKIVRNKKLPDISKKINPNKYVRYTTVPKLSSLRKYYGPGIVSHNIIDVDGFERVSGNIYFDMKQMEWKKSRNPYYIHNMYTHRPSRDTRVNSKPRKLSKSLYSFSKKRNNWVPKNIIKSSATIPLVGLKNNDVKTLVR